MSGKIRLRHPAARRYGLFAGCTLLAALGLSFSAQAAWDATLSRAVPVDASAGLAPVPAGQMMNVHLSLKIQNRAALDTLLKNLYTPGNPQYGRYLTPAQFAAAFSPSAAQAQKVVDYLKGAGFSNVTLAGNRLLVSARGSAALVQKAFNTQLVLLPRDGRIVRANLTDMQVPDSLGGIVLAVLGPNNMEQYRTSLEQQRERSVYPPLTAKASRPLAALRGAKAAAAGTAQVMTSFPPTAWDVAYDAGASPDGTQSTIAISTYGSEDVGVVEDLRQMERQYGLPYVPVEVRETAPFSTPTPTSSGDDEWDLDTQSSTAIAHNLKKLIIYATEDSSDLVLQYNEFATRADATAGNMSYGTCELVAATGLLLPGPASSDQAFMQAMSEGLSWHASTGDDGGVCSPINLLGAPLAGIPLLANYPDSSPYVVAVGGTSLVTDASFNYSSETAWLSGGGGISVLEAAPSWQQGIVPSAALTSIPGLGLIGTALGGTGVGRGVPDIAMNAGIYLPELAIASAADVIVGGEHEAVVGTSLSSPLAVGSWARLQSAHCGALGFAAPAYYALDTSGGLFSTAKGFHDITVGTNGDYVATPGWDYTTGFGSIDLAAVNAALPAAQSGCNPAPAPPLAQLKLSGSGGDAPLSISYDASGSSDPNGDTLEYYTLDYGDDTLPLQQASPAFQAHTYTAPGVYTVSLTVRNSHGAVSAPVTQTVTVAGLPAACAVPGKTLLSVPAGSASFPLPVPIVGPDLPPIPDPLPAQNLLSASVAEPAGMPGKLVFTIQVSSLSSVPPLTRWAVSFTIPGDTTPRYVSMSTDSGTPTFFYGERGTVAGIDISALGLLTLFDDLGPLDSTSNYNADGTITLVLDKSVFNLSTGQTLQAIVALTGIRIDLPPSITGSGTELAVGETVDAGSTRFGYTLIGNDACGTAGSGSSSSGGSGSSSSSSSSSGGASSGGGSSGSSSSSSSGGSSSSGSSTSSGSSGSSSSGSSSGSASSSSGSSGSSSSSSSSSGSSSSGGHGGSSSSSSGGVTGGSSSSSGGSSSGGGSSSSGATSSSSGGTAPSGSGSSSGGSSSSGGGSGSSGGAFGFTTLLPLGLAALRRRRRAR